MDKLNNNIESLIAKYLNGTISDTEYRELTSWIGLSDENQLEFDSIREIWLASNLTNENFRFDSQAAFERFQKRKTSLTAIPVLQKSKKIILSYPWAAAILVFAVLGGMFLRNLTRSLAEEGIPVAYHEVIVPNGSRSKMVLPDSSYITVNAGTTLRYNTDFGVKNRNIWLDGEAYFVVNKSHTPFIVHSGTVQIKAIGTEFNVRAYSSENQIETTLIEGKVVVTDSDNLSEMPGEVALFPNQKLIVAKNAVSSPGKGKTSRESIAAGKKSQLSKSARNMIKEDGVDPAPDISWKDDEWVIYRESLGDLSVKLERRYNVNIIFVDEHLKSLRYNGTLPDESLEQVLKIMSIVSPIRYTVTGKTVVFSENKYFKKPQ